MKRFLALVLSALLVLSTLVINVSAAGTIDFNFDNLADDDYTQADITDLFGATFATGSTYTASAENGMLTMNTAGKGEDSFSFSLDEVFTEGTLEFKARFKIDENTAASGGYNMFNISVSDESGDAVEILRSNSNDGGFARPQGNSDNHGWVGPSLTKDLDGFYNVSIAITDDVPETITNYADQTFYITVNDMNAGGAQKSSHTAKVLDGIAGIKFVASKNGASAANNTKVTFDKLSFKEFKPEVIGISAPSGSISPKIGTINLLFNTAVDPATVANGIFFEKADGGAVAGLNIVPATDGKSVTVSFDDLDITDYVLSVTAGLHALADGAPFVPFTSNYTAVVEPLAVMSVSNEGGTVMPSIGTIEITFNNPINPETIEEGITFLRENGRPIPGGATVKMGDTNDKVLVLVGRVGQGNYVLTIDDEKLMDAYGDTIDEPVTYGYIVEDANPAMMDVDFSGIEERPYSYDEIESLAGGVFSGASNFVLEGKGGSLEIIEPASKQGSSFRIDSAEVFETGEISFDFVLKRNTKTGHGTGDNQFRINAVTSSGSSAPITMNIAPTQIQRPTGLNTWYSGEGATLSADQDGFLNFSIVFTDDIPASRVTATSKYIMYVYDNNKGSTDPSFTQIYNGSSLPDIAGISFTTYKNSTALPYESAIEVKSVKATLNEEKIPNHVMSSDAEGANPSADKINLVFTNTFKNITADGISFMNGDKVIAATVNIIADEKTISLEPVDYLKYGETYTVSFPAPLQVFEFTTEAYPERLSASVNGMLLEVRLVNGEADEYVIVATYKDAEGNKISANGAKTAGTSASIAIPADAESVVVNAYKVVDGCYIKASLPVERSL